MVSVGVGVDALPGPRRAEVRAPFWGRTVSLAASGLRWGGSRGWSEGGRGTSQNSADSRAAASPAPSFPSPPAAVEGKIPNAVEAAIF